MESFLLLNKKRQKHKIQNVWKWKHAASVHLTQIINFFTAESEAIITSVVIDAKQKIDVTMLDIPNVFVQTEIPLNGDKIIMKVRGQMVDVFLEKIPGEYDKYVRYEVGQKIIYVRILKALYGILVSFLNFL